jgi:hypothetical protein
VSATIRERIADVLEPVAPAERLAALRILVGAFTAIYVLARIPGFTSPLAQSPKSFAPVGLAHLLSQPMPAWALYALLGLTIATSACFVLGLRFRITGPLFAASLLLLTSYRNSFGMIFHTENLFVCHVAVLAFTDAAAAWSLDARGHGPPAPDRRFGWAIVLLSTVTVMAYLLAGVAKVRVSGLGWAVGEILRNHVAHDNLRKLLLGDGYSPIGGWLLRFPWLFPPLAAASLALELFAPLALLSRRLGKAFAVAAYAFHFGVLLLMWILFPYPLSSIAFLSFFEPEKGLARLRDRFAKRAVAEPVAREQVEP